MEHWIYNIAIIIVLYSIWALGLELLSKKYSSCECLSLQTYIFAGTIALILLLFHIKKGCTHYKSISDIKNTPLLILIGLIIIACAIVMANRHWYQAVNKVNSGFISATTSTYIVLVTFASAYLYRTKISTKQYIGIATILGGTFLLVN
jgi:drug/metabolite transporter (DMT)-like permease